MGEGNGYFVLSKRKSSGNVLVVFYCQLPIVRNDTIFGVKYQNLLVRCKLQRDVHGNTYLYKVCCAHYRYFTSMLAIELFILHDFFHFLDVSLSTYLYISLYRSVAYH